ncbi:MAG TPA: ACP S-malonyltransferase [Bdellovibrionota bacterium]|nr:ACP S-malonyltransferase [Bdellovibrionota bacterium]
MKTAFLFPGQGSQAVGMGESIFSSFPTAKRTREEADEALGFSLSDVIRNGPAEKLKATENAQPAILAVSVAIGRVLIERGIQPTVLAGHSLGEYSALVSAGALGFADAVRLVRLRGRFMQEAVPLGQGAMSAILGTEEGLIEEVCRQISAKGMQVDPANYNCPGQVVISGTKEGVAAAVDLLKQRGAKRCVALEVSAPFHCSLLKPAADKLRPELEKVEWNDPRIPYIANVDCAVVRSKGEIIHRLAEQVWRPVRWTHSLQKIFLEFKPTRVIEVGPGQVVLGHVKKVDDTVERFPSETKEALEKIPSA